MAPPPSEPLAAAASRLHWEHVAVGPPFQSPLRFAFQSRWAQAHRTHKRRWASGRVALVFEESVINSIIDSVLSFTYECQSHYLMRYQDDINTERNMKCQYAPWPRDSSLVNKAPDSQWIYVRNWKSANIILLQYVWLMTTNSKNSNKYCLANTQRQSWSALLNAPLFDGFRWIVWLHSRWIQFAHIQSLR